MIGRVGRFVVDTRFYASKSQIGVVPGYDWVGKKFNKCYPVGRDGKVGFVDARGEFIPLVYDFDFRMNFANSTPFIVAVKDGLCGLIYRQTGDVAVEFVWQDIGSKYENLGLRGEYIPVQYGHKWGIVNVITDEVQIEPIYDEVRTDHFFDGFDRTVEDNNFAVRIGQKWGVVGEDGETIIKPKYVKPFRFIDGLAIVVEDIGDDGLIYKVITISGLVLFESNNKILRIGPNVFGDIADENNDKELNFNEVRKIQVYPNYIVISINGLYKPGYCTVSGEFLGMDYSKKGINNGEVLFYPFAEYEGSGRILVLDRNGNEMRISEESSSSAFEEIDN